MRLRLSVLFLTVCCMSVCAQQKGELSFNYGVKGGYSSTIYEIQRLVVADQPINVFTSKSQLSSFYTLFGRFNYKRHYLQTEVSYNISKYALSFPTVQWYSSAEEDETSTIKTQINGIEIPVFYGYHIMQDGPYGMSFFIGPKAKYIIVDHSGYVFENFPYGKIVETIYPLNFSLMVGLGVNIGRIFFDFSFEYGLHNISNHFSIDEVDFDSSELVFDRRKNVLSFSVGFMF